MKSRARVFVLLAVLLFIAHFFAAVSVSERLTADLKHHLPTEQIFAPSFAAAALSLPLLRWSVMNDVLMALLLSAVFVFLRFRTALIVIVVVPVLVVIGMIATAKALDSEIASGWRELRPRPIPPAPAGKLATTLGDQKFDPLTAYFTAQIAHDDSRIDPLPQDVDWFVTAHRTDIDALQRELPATTDRLARFRMHRILLVDALQTHSADEVAAAGKLADVLLHQANLDSALYAMAAEKNQLAVIRKLGLTPAGSRFDPHQQLIDAIAATSNRIMDLQSPWYAWPYAELCKAESAYSGLQQARIIHNLRGVSFAMPPIEDRQPRVPFNPIGVLGGGARFAWQANDLVSRRTHPKS